MIKELTRYKYRDESYRELTPMLERIIEHNGFFEGWSIDNQPHGSRNFKLLD